MAYTVSISNNARKQLKEIPATYAKQIRNHIDKLAENPRPHGSIKLKGYEDEYRIRVGVYRILYTINDKEIRVEVIAIGHRKDIYDSHYCIASNLQTHVANDS